MKSKSRFIGRAKELAVLSGLWEKRTSSFVVCRGRRRIGKSTLIEEFASRSGCRFIEISGLPPDEKMTNQRQLDSFCERLSMQTGRPRGSAESWQQAFAFLADAVRGRARTVVLLDEISWMGGWNPDFPGYLKESWDKKLRKHANLVFVLCGIDSAWIVEIIMNSTGFVGRNSLDIELKELSLRDSVRIWGQSAERMSTREKLDMLSVTGGVPKYLEEVRPSLTVDENIRRMCYHMDSLAQ